MTTLSKAQRLARSFASEWLRPDAPEQATPALVDTLSTVLLAYGACARQGEEHKRPVVDVHCRRCLTSAQVERFSYAGTFWCSVCQRWEKPSETIAIGPSGDWALDTLPVLRTDVEALEDLVREYVDLPEEWVRTINRLRALLGKGPA